jgi:chromosomal replication initiator protein
MIEMLQSSAHPTELEQAQRVWIACLGILAENVTTQSFKTWFEPIVPLHLHGGALTLQTPSQFFREWLEEHFDGMLNAAVGRVLGKDAILHYEVAREDPVAEDPVVVAPPPPVKIEKKNFPAQPETFRTAHTSSQFGSC